MSIYNLKINTNGTYRPFHGYTVVSMVEDDLSPIEEFIKNSKYISKYYSALPSSSYHATVYNIWCHGQDPLPVQYSWLSEVENRISQVSRNTKVKSRIQPRVNIENFKQRYFATIKSNESHTFINDDVFLPLMIKADELCKNICPDDFIAKIKPTHMGSRVFFTKETEDKLVNLRQHLTDLFKRDDSRLVPHVTFAYRYRDINEEDKQMLHAEIEELNILISKLVRNGVNFSAPRAVWFRSMLEYNTIDKIYL